MTDIITEEVSYEAPWEFTSAASRLLTGTTSRAASASSNAPSRLSSSTDSDRTLNSQERRPKLDNQGQSQSPRHSVGSNTSTPKHEAIPSTLNTSPNGIACGVAASQYRCQQQKTRPRHATTTQIGTNISMSANPQSETPWSYRGPESDLRPAEEYDPPWDFHRSVHKLRLAKSPVHDPASSDTSSINFYDPVAFSAADKPAPVTNKIRMFSNNNSKISHNSTSTAQSRGSKTKSVCVMDRQQQHHLTVTTNNNTKLLTSQKNSPKSGSLGSTASSGSRPSSAGSRQHEVNDGSNSSSSRSPNIQTETTVFCSCASPPTNGTQFINSEQEVRNRLIQQIASGDSSIPVDALPQKSLQCLGQVASTKKTPPQPAIRWSKVKKQIRATDSSPQPALNRMSPAPVKSRSFSADDQLDHQDTINQSASRPINQSIVTSPLSQSYYDKVPEDDSEQYDVPWEFNTKKQIDKLKNHGVTISEVLSKTGATSSSNSSSARSSSHLSRSKTPPAAQSQRMSTIGIGTNHNGNAQLTKQRSLSAVQTNTNIRNNKLLVTGKPPSRSPAAGNRKELSLNFGCAALNSVPEEFDANVALEHQGWYHGNITRQEAEDRLHKNKEGSYLVRVCESNKDEYALSLKSARGYMHMKMQCHKGKGWILGYFSQPFDRIPEMIRFYSANKLPIKGAEHMCLLQPINEPLL